MSARRAREIGIHRVTGGRIGSRVAAAALTLAATVVAAAPAAAAPNPTATQCDAARATRNHPTRVNADPKPGAPRVFAVQMKLSARDVISSGAFARKVECLLRDQVLPHVATGRPNVVVFDEDAGLLTGAAGPRGRPARRIVADPRGDRACTGQAFPCRTLHVLRLLGESRARERRFYGRSLGRLDGVEAPFVLATDTIARTFMRTFSDAARRHGLYVVAANDQAPLRQTTSRAAVRALAPEGARTAYVATSAKVYNSVFLWGPRRVRRRGADVERNLLASNRKVPLTPIEIAIGLTAGPATGAAARANLAPFRIPGTQARLGFATSLPAFTFGAPGGTPAPTSRGPTCAASMRSGPTSSCRRTPTPGTGRATTATGSSPGSRCRGCGPPGGRSPIRPSPSTTTSRRCSPATSPT